MKEPKIRLKGFTREWNETTIGEIAAFSKGRGYSKSDLKTQGNPIILYGRLYTNYASTIKEVDTFATLQKGSVLSKGNEVIIPASGETPEDIAIASYVQQQGVILGGDLNVLTFDSTKINPAFAAIGISNSKTHTELSGYAQGKSVVHLHNGNIAKGHLTYPSVEEQESIISYINSLDSLIQSTTKKIESLKQVKAASLQSMFPQEGETTPRVRFKGFTGEWEKSTFGELLIFERPDNYIVSNDVYSDEFSTPVLTANKGFILGYTNERRTFNSPCIIFDDFTLDSKFVDFPFMVKSSALKILTLRNEKKDSLYFVYTLLKQTKIEVLGHARHYISVVQPTQVYMPKDSTEQKMIASFFSNLDSQIALLSQQLEKLQQIKSACLDNMFV